MKVLKFKGKMSLKNKILIIIAAVLLIGAISIGVIYAINEEAREWININILRKEITEEDVATIQLDTDKTEYITAYDKYIAILCNGKLDIYSSYGTKQHELNINISNPIFESNGQYLLIAENKRTKYISNIKWKNRMGK